MFEREWVGVCVIFVCLVLCVRESVCVRERERERVQVGVGVECVCVRVCVCLIFFGTG